MDDCKSQLKAYISVDDAKEQRDLALEERDCEWSEKFRKLAQDNATLLSEMEHRYNRANNFVKTIFDRLVKQREIEDKVFPQQKSPIGRNTYVKGAFVEDSEVPKDIKSLGPSGSGVPSVTALREIDKILTLGFDFERLLTVIKEDELLAGQWRKIMMTMKLSDSKFSEE